MLDFSLGTRKSNLVFQDQITKFSAENLQTEKVEFRARDDMLLSLVMVYDKRYYSEESPWILFTEGVDSHKS